LPSNAWCLQWSNASKRRRILSGQLKVITLHNEDIGGRWRWRSLLRNTTFCIAKRTTAMITCCPCLLFYIAGMFSSLYVTFYTLIKRSLSDNQDEVFAESISSLTLSSLEKLQA
jgi:hypothetical protein